MNGFKELYYSYAKNYDEQKEEIKMPSGHVVLNFSFHSDYSFDFTRKGLFRGDLFYHELVRSKVPENSEFIYPVMVPDPKRTYDRAILLFHGLNEKNWDKYFVWAGYLAQMINCPVIMFPLAYHINRVPKSWSDPRVMSEIASTRIKNDDPVNSTFANAALSTRMQFHPELFIYSGLQSCHDVIRLVDDIRNGNNQLLTKDAHIDIFSYSIGAFFSQILMLANPGNRFGASKLFIFCGGPTFDLMNGNSKYIMDSVAFKSLLELKHRQKLKQIKKKVFSTQDSTLMETWQGLDLMMYCNRGRKKRESLFEKLSDRIYAVMLEKDAVMPVDGVIRTLRGKKKRIEVPVEVIDFPYNYSHEQPFPLGDDKIQNLVDRCFTVVFEKAVDFFSDEFLKDAENTMTEKVVKKESRKAGKREEEQYLIPSEV
ncbi:MAG TPA: DUF6051 family protein [Prolixibacteraceae bacterium]|nr:DUF6051 family protein [Prolixibacteraceae bacterium]